MMHIGSSHDEQVTRGVEGATHPIPGRKVHHNKCKGGQLTSVGRIFLKEVYINIMVA